MIPPDWRWCDTTLSCRRWWAVRWLWQLAGIQKAGTQARSKLSPQRVYGSTLYSVCSSSVWSSLLAVMADATHKTSQIKCDTVVVRAVLILELCPGCLLPWYPTWKYPDLSLPVRILVEPITRRVFVPGYPGTRRVTCLRCDLPRHTSYRQP